jgi:hypothetical protein
MGCITSVPIAYHVSSQNAIDNTAQHTRRSLAAAKLPPSAALQPAFDALAHKQNRSDTKQ